MKIVFYGTPVFAIASLEKLAEAGYEIAAVVTAPDKPSGRGLKMQCSPVKQWAVDRSLLVLQPEKLSDPEFLESLRRIGPDVQVVVAFRYMPRSVWSLAKFGTFNLHASLLPQYRGAAPINWAIINGETTTGLTTFFIDEHIDTGKILFSSKVEIGENESAGELHDRLMVIGSDLVIKTVSGIQDGSITPIDQLGALPVHGAVKGAPKLSKETCRIDWSESVKNIHNHIRGLSPYPAAFTQIQFNDSKAFVAKIIKVRPIYTNHEFLPGTIFTEGKKILTISTVDGFVEVLELQPEGKRSMNIVSFLNGIQLQTPTVAGLSAGKCL